jgi:outer membrane protein assembly factor BamB
MARASLLLALCAVLAACGSSHASSGGMATPRATTEVGGDWNRFGYDAARHDAGPAHTGITAANVGRLTRQRVDVGGTVDSSPIYLRGVTVDGAEHDVFFVTTSYGKAVAVDASNGSVLWTFTPSGFRSWAGSPQITNASPVADPSRRWIYSASPDGRVHKVAVASGAEVTSGGWPVTVTRLPSREKLGTALNFSRGMVIVTTGGYIGDPPPYQGHVVTIAARTGRIVHVWNSLCSNRHVVISPRSCRGSDSAIWARAGAVVEPRTGDLLVATGNGPFDGRTNWGDSVLKLTPNASRLVASWTPRDQAGLEAGDVDLGSTAPALLGRGLAVQGGKDGKLRLLSLRRLGGRLGRTGGELQTIAAPGQTDVFTTPAVWHGRLYVATESGLACYVLHKGRLGFAWRSGTGGTSPVVAGGLLYVFNGTLDVYNPTTGRHLAGFRAGSAHWNSPIVTDGRVAVGEGSANDHSQSGVLDIFRLR